ncbi:MAG: hypothetical protein PHH62_04315 [Endomicrobiaceae bacterium]|nr:hypothetical protein [Endomicrobiaceae bacterium]
MCYLVNVEAATKTIVEKDAQGNAVKTTITETDKFGNETTTIINHKDEPTPQPQQFVPAPTEQTQTAPTIIQQAPTTTQNVVTTTAAPKTITPKKGLKVGSNLLYGRLGLSIPTNSPDGEIKIYGYEPLAQSWGTIGIDFGLTYLHYFSNYLALGAEFGLDAFLGKKSTSTNIEVTQSTVFTNFLLLAHIYLNNIEEESRFYIPIGIGAGSASYTVSATYLGYNDSADYNGGGTCYVIGIGGNWRNEGGNISGTELRYTHSTVDGNEPDSIKDQEIGIFSILFYYGFDF